MCRAGRLSGIGAAGHGRIVFAAGAAMLAAK
jgi:hypothetical protein